ncbi:MAG: VWA domain-containing protein [Solirubrobacterales bacterium]
MIQLTRPLACVFMALIVLSQFLASPPASAAPSSADAPIMLVVDSSGSMSEDDGTGTIKIDGAKVALLDFLNNISENTPLGLLSYPSKSGGNCDPGLPAFDITNRDPATMSAFIRGLEPDGDTPTAEALRTAFEEIKQSHGSGTLVLVSDGESTCDPPCDVANELADQGVDIDTITVGFRISDSGREELECIADALNGRYVDANDNGELQGILDDLSQPKLTISQLSNPARVVAEAGGEADGRVKIEATIKNEGKREATDVSMRLRFDLNGPGVARPIVRIGNLAGGASLKVAWQVWPPATAIDHRVNFTVIGSATNSPTDAQRTGTFRVIDLNSAADAGSILKGKKRIAILGDSYSSGEGAESYIRDSDRIGSACHQSSDTYLREVFALPDSNVIACSGAVANDISAANQPNSKPAQAAELAQLYERKTGSVQAVVMTLGGNDFQFPTLARSCILASHTCDDRVYDKPGLELWGGTPFAEFKNRGVGNQGSAERAAIKSAYESIHAVLNSAQAVARRGSIAPIIVLGYPLPIPLTGRSCLPMADKLSRGEILAVGGFALELNAVIEGIVADLRSEGKAVFYVPNTENALLPDHTVCDPPDRAFARSLVSADPAVFEMFPRITGAIAAKNPTYFWSKDFKNSMRSASELVHPNAKGYAAVSSAILRWTRGPGGQAANEFLKTVEAEPTATLSTGLTSDGMVDENGNLILQGGSRYPLTVDGYAPQSDASAFLRSQPQLAAHAVADQGGRIKVEVPIPSELEAGQHHIEVVGFGQNGKQLKKTVAFQITADRTPSVGLILAAIALVATLLGLLLFGLSRGARAQLRTSALHEGAV